MHKCFFLLPLLLLLAGGCGGSKPELAESKSELSYLQKELLPECSGGFTLSVGSETITSDEIVLPWIEHFRPIAQRSDFERFKKQVRPEIEKIVTSKVSDILLYRQAKKQAGEGIDDRLEKAADAEVKRFVVGFGGDYARAEEELKRSGMDWASFKEYQKKMILNQDYIRRQLPEHSPVTYSELLDCYNDMKDKSFAIPAMIKFRLIDIEPAKLELADSNQNRLDESQRLAENLVERLRSGEDFGELAKQYSHGHRRAFGGLWQQLEPGALAEPYDILATECEKTQPGQLAGPIEVKGHIFIMKLEAKQAEGFEPFEKVQSQVETRILLNRQKQAVDDLSAKLAHQASLEQSDEFIDFCLKKIYRISNQN